MIGSFGATILTDCKNGSDKPNDNTIRLTLIRTPGTRGGYTDQGTQDIGHHEFTYGIVGHGGGWRESGSDWQGQRLNDPLIAFQITRHAGALGGQFSLLKVSNPRVRLLALKKAEQGDEITVRLVELDGKPQADVKVSFAAPNRRRSRGERARAAGRSGENLRRSAGDFIHGLSAENVCGKAG
jgi:alpha-mannosidase